MILIKEIAENLLLEKLKDDIELQRIDGEEAKHFILSHYLGNAPSGGTIYYGVFHKPSQKLLGVISYSSPTKPTDYQEISLNPVTGESYINSNEIVELTRLYFPDEIDLPNIESFTISAGNKLIKRDKPQIKVIITRADAGRHVGSIYQATNAIYLGKSRDSMRPFHRETNVEIRSDEYEKYGFNSIRELRRMLDLNPNIPVELKTRSGKHKYIYIVTTNKRTKEEILTNLITKPQPYPKKEMSV